MKWQLLDEIDGQFSEGERIVAMMRTHTGWPRIVVFEATGTGDDLSFTSSDGELVCDIVGWVPEEALAKFLSGEVLTDADGISVCAECMNEPCQCSASPCQSIQAGCL